MIFGKWNKLKISNYKNKQNFLNDFESTIEHVSSVYTVIQVLFCGYFMQYCNKT
jgi:hypothetical protein